MSAAQQHHNETMHFEANEVMMIERPYPLREAEFERLLRPSKLTAWIHGVLPATLLYWIQALVRRFFEQPVSKPEYVTGLALLIVLIVLAIFNWHLDTRRANLIKRMQEHFDSHDPQEVTKT